MSAHYAPSYQTRILVFLMVVVVADAQSACNADTVFVVEYVRMVDLIPHFPNGKHVRCAQMCLYCRIC